MFQTDLLDTVIQVSTPTEKDPDHFTFGRVRAVYIAEGHLRIVVLLTSGYMVDMAAHCAKVKKSDLPERGSNQKRDQENT